MSSSSQTALREFLQGNVKKREKKDVDEKNRVKNGSISHSPKSLSGIVCSGCGRDLDLEGCKTRPCSLCGTVFLGHSMHYIGLSISQHLSSDCQRQQLITPPTVRIKPYSWVAFNRKRKGGEKWSMPYKEVKSGATWGGKGTDVGDKIEGKLVRTETNTNNDKIHDYIFTGVSINGEKGEGETRVWGSAILENRLQGEKYLNKVMRITFNGLVKAKKGKAKDYKVEVKE